MSINLYSDGFPKEKFKWPLLFSMGIIVIFKSNFKTVQKSSPSHWQLDCSGAVCN